MKKTWLIAAVLALGTGLACSTAGDEGVTTVEIPVAGSESAHGTGGVSSTGPSEGVLPAGLEALGITNARMPRPNLLSSGQLSRDQMTSLKELGYRRFISLQTADEGGAGWEEAFAASTGLEFHRIPVDGAAGITRENAERLAGLLETAGDEPVAVYCRSGNRVGALLALKAYFDDGMSVEEAVSFGKTAGLTGAEGTVRELVTAK